MRIRYIPLGLVVGIDASPTLVSTMAVAWRTERPDSLSVLLLCIVSCPLHICTQMEDFWYKGGRRSKLRERALLSGFHDR